MNLDFEKKYYERTDENHAEAEMFRKKRNDISLKKRLFCAAPHELIIGPIMTFLGLK